MQLKLHPNAGPMLVEPDPTSVALDKRLLKIPPQSIIARIPNQGNDGLQLLVDHDYVLNALAHDYVAVREALALIARALLGAPPLAGGFPEHPDMTRARAALADLETRLVVPRRAVDDDERDDGKH